MYDKIPFYRFSPIQDFKNRFLTSFGMTAVQKIRFNPPKPRHLRSTKDGCAKNPRKSASSVSSAFYPRRAKPSFRTK